jgi:hypothetical protein
VYLTVLEGKAASVFRVVLKMAIFLLMIPIASYQAPSPLAYWSLFLEPTNMHPTPHSTHFSTQDGGSIFLETVSTCQQSCRE